jgi:hypothetical protein
LTLRLSEGRIGNERGIVRKLWCSLPPVPRKIPLPEDRRFFSSELGADKHGQKGRPVKLPYIKWYYRDASADLRLIPPVARCVWYEMLWIMAASDRYGYLERQGRAMTDDEVGMLAGLSPAIVAEARPILVADNLPGIDTETGIWYSRRMVEDERRRQVLSDAGKRGGGSPLLASSPLPVATELIAITQNPSKRKATFKPTLKGRHGEGSKGTEYTPAFESFWTDYKSISDRSPGSKVEAFRAWSRLSAEDQAAMTDRLLQYLRFRTSQPDGVFVASMQDACRWIKNRRWEDLT